MSENPTLITAEHFRYVASHTTQDDALLSSLRAAAAAAGIPPISIASAQASFIQILLKATRAKQVVEVGTLGGYSAIWMARALPPDGRVRTLEISPKHAEFARSWIAKSDVASRIEVDRRRRAPGAAGARSGLRGRDVPRRRQGEFIPPTSSREYASCGAAG